MCRSTQGYTDCIVLRPVFGEGLNITYCERARGSQVVIHYMTNFLLQILRYDGSTFPDKLTKTLFSIFRSMFLNNV